MGTSGRPIGYWLKHLDGLLEEVFDGTLAQEGLARRHWQVLSTLAEAPRSRHEITAALEPFWEESAVTLGDVLDALIARDWLSTNTAGSALTRRGRAAHARLRGRIQALRQRLVDGLTNEDYEQTVDVLRRMADNLEHALRA